jgi:hypothetical protein
MAEEQKPKTEEEMLAEHKKAFEERPKDFVDIKNIICMATRHPNPEITAVPFINTGTRKEWVMAQAELNRALNRALTYIEDKQMKDRESKIVQPSMTNRVRGMFGGKR